MTKYQDDLGFTVQETKTGELMIFHHGKLATTLRGMRAARFMTELESVSFSEQQQLMARITGNYRRGNERCAKNHQRNR